MAKTKTPELDGLIAQDPDLVDRIFDYLLSEFPQLAGADLVDAKKAVREEFAGQKAWVAQRSSNDRQELVQQVLSLFDGRNASEVGRRLNISRATVYRMLKQAGKSKPSQVFWK